MKYSIQRKMTIIFSTVLLGTLSICLLANNFFLERYYLDNKKNVLNEIYQELDTASKQEELENEEFVEKLSVYCEKTATSLFVMGSDGRIKLYSMKEYPVMRERLYKYLFSQADTAETPEIIEETNFYTLREDWDMHTKAEYLEMIGILANGDAFILRIAIAPIRESVSLANRFLAYVGLAAVIVGAIVIQVLSSRIVEPILELAYISERMSALDFNVKFTGKNNDEVGVLGNHMNALSEILEKTISELKTANNELQRDIEQKEKNDEMRKEFLSNVSHELKTPIALIQGYAEGLQECVNDDEESRAFYCEVIIDEASKMNQMVKKLLALNELEFGTEVVEMERFDITAMICNLLSSTKILFEQKQVRVIFEQAEPVYVWANEFKMEEVLNNYISNAIHHVEGENIIKVTIQKQEDRVRVGVFNTGKAIPEQDVSRIWDKFYKVDKARTREYGGSGVGLSIVKAIMESMHQDYGVINYDNGVEFWCSLDDKA